MTLFTYRTAIRTFGTRLRLRTIAGRALLTLLALTLLALFARFNTTNFCFQLSYLIGNALNFQRVIVKLVIFADAFIQKSLLFMFPRLTCCIPFTLVNRS
jgi:hypothetical protein